MQGDFALRGHLYDFKEVTGPQMTARVTLDLEMRDLKNGATVWTHYYTFDEPASGKDVPAVVVALDKNVQRAVKEVWIVWTSISRPIPPNNAEHFANCNP